MKLLAALLVLLAALALVTPAGAQGRWSPTPGASWQWQLQGTVNTNVPGASAFDVDGFDTPASKVAEIHSRGAGAVCYISAGSWEDWRSDAGRFPASVKGRQLDGWAGERWLDVRQWDVLGPIMRARMEMCRAKGFDAVEADNVDAYTNSTGFPLTATHQLAYNRNLADTAHSLGLSIALKNDVDQLAALEPSFDFAINEECARYNECGGYRVFTDAGKAVWNVEYGTSRFPGFCRSTYPIFGQASMLRDLGLSAGGVRRTCSSAG